MHLLRLGLLQDMGVIWTKAGYGSGKPALFSCLLAWFSWRRGLLGSHLTQRLGLRTTPATACGSRGCVDVDV
jgi:hypothetical protein